MKNGIRTLLATIGVSAAAISGAAQAQDESGEAMFADAVVETCGEYFFKSWNIEASSEGTGLSFTKLAMGESFPGPGGVVAGMPVFGVDGADMYVHENIAVGRCEIFAGGLVVAEAFDAVAAQAVTEEKGFVAVDPGVEAAPGVSFARYERVVDDIVFFLALSGFETADRTSLTAVTSFYPAS